MNGNSLLAADENQRILARIARLSAGSRAQWGKMNVAQMLAHCQVGIRIATGELELKRNWLGLLFGRMAKKKLLSPAPWSRGMPTAPEFRVTDARDFVRERDALVAQVRQFSARGAAGLTKAPHPFFGPLTVDEWDLLQWRHLDHHLRQFGA